MKSIYKYPLKYEGTQHIAMPAGAEILCVQVQAEQPTIWAMVDTAMPNIDRIIVCCPTGRAVEVEDMKYIGTVQLDGGRVVFHYFEDVNSTVALPAGMPTSMAAHVPHIQH